MSDEKALDLLGIKGLRTLIEIKLSTSSINRLQCRFLPNMLRASTSEPIFAFSLLICMTRSP